MSNFSSLILDLRPVIEHLNILSPARSVDASNQPDLPHRLNIDDQNINQRSKLEQIIFFPIFIALFKWSHRPKN